MHSDVSASFLAGKVFLAFGKLREPMTPSQQKAQAAWNRIELLGGGGVWDGEMCVVSLAKSCVKDDDLALFDDFPFVQILDISDTEISNEGLAQLDQLTGLQSLVAINTKIQREHPSVAVRATPIPKGSINPFTGKPF